MALQSNASPDRRPSLQERLARNPDGILEQIAREWGISTFDVVRELPALNRSIVSGDRFAEIMQEMTGWGEILLIVHSADIVLECKGALSPGAFGRGYFNLRGESPIGGHIRAENCKHIAFVSRPFMGRPSRSVQFFNAAGEAMFKVFVRRDEARNLIAQQAEAFDRLRASLETADNSRG